MHQEKQETESKETLEEIVEETAESNLEAVQEEILEEAQETQAEGEEEKDPQVQDLANQLEVSERALQETIGQMQRLQADFANYKKRVEKEKSDIYLYASEKLVVELLGILDNLDRAVENIGLEAEESVRQGIELVLKQFKELLGKHGVEEIEALNQPFDMHQHHAVMQEEADAESNTVIEVYQKGYRLHQKVVRPAMVKVAR